MFIHLMSLHGIHTTTRLNIPSSAVSPLRKVSFSYFFVSERALQWSEREKSTHGGIKKIALRSVWWLR
jgi:hypothetical protein